MNFETLVLSLRPNQFLVLPPNFASTARPHALSPVFAAKPDELIAAVKTIALAEPRTTVRSAAPGEIEFVQRSRLMRFPDFITVKAIPATRGGTALAILSRAKFGIRDFGVNRARVERWLGELRKVCPLIE